MFSNHFEGETQETKVSSNHEFAISKSSQKHRHIIQEYELFRLYSKMYIIFYVEN